MEMMDAVFLHCLHLAGIMGFWGVKKENIYSRCLFNLYPALYRHLKQVAQAEAGLYSAKCKNMNKNYNICHSGIKLPFDRPVKTHLPCFSICVIYFSYINVHHTFNRLEFSEEG